MPPALAHPRQAQRSTLAFGRFRRRRLARGRVGFCRGFWGLARSLRRELDRLPRARDRRSGQRSARASAQS